MKKKIIFIYFAIFLFVSITFSYFFLFNIYGNEIRNKPVQLYAVQSELMFIEVVPINALGTRALFRNSSASFEVIEGLNLIEIVEENNSKGLLKIRSKGQAGVVGIKIKSQYSLLPEYLEIKILPLLTYLYQKQ
jgi:hypothetical protein